MKKERKRVLVVDGSAAVRHMLTQTLDQAGYDVVAASSGEDALSIISDNPADMIISDLDMPDMGGFELIQQIRRKRENRFVPIIMLTIDDTARIRREGISVGISGWLVKPFRPESVLSIVRLIS